MTNVGEVDGRHATLSGELVEEGKGDRIDRVILAVVRQRLLLVVAVLPPVATEDEQLIPNTPTPHVERTYTASWSVKDNDQQSLDTKTEQSSRTYVGVLGHVERHGTVH